MFQCLVYLFDLVYVCVVDEYIEKSNDFAKRVPLNRLNLSKKRAYVLQILRNSIQAPRFLRRRQFFFPNISIFEHVGSKITPSHLQSVLKFVKTGFPVFFFT